jgi:hypothetical protein
VLETCGLSLWGPPRPAHNRLVASLAFYPLTHHHDNSGIISVERCAATFTRLSDRSSLISNPKVPL